VISKAEWHPQEMKPDFGGRWRLAPAQHFNIHIEPQFNVLGGVLDSFLHYEINPCGPNRAASWLARFTI
jgi:hypothetical protein